MNYFSEENGSLIFRENGETVMVTPWGTNSLRVRSAILGEIKETEAALLPKEEISGGVIHLEEDGMSAVITNGAMGQGAPDHLYGCGWKSAAAGDRKRRCPAAKGTSV